MARLAIRVQPGASRSCVVGRTGEEWKIAVAPPPAEGKANRAVIELLARTLGVPKSRVTLVHGAAGRRKLVDIEGLSNAEVERELQRKLIP